MNLRMIPFLSKVTFASSEIPTSSAGNPAVAPSRSRDISFWAQMARDSRPVHAAKRALKSVQRSVEHLEDMKDEAIHRVKRQPILAVGMALGIGLILGCAVGWVSHRAQPQGRSGGEVA